MNDLQFTVTALSDWDTLARKMIPYLCQAGWTALSGPLGIGKTTFVQAIVRSLAGDHETDVNSPTFDLCHRYDTVPPVLHYDLYRLEQGNRLADLDWDPQLQDGHVILVEWAERFAFADDPPARIIQLGWCHSGTDKKNVRNGQRCGRLLFCH